MRVVCKNLSYTYDVDSPFASAALKNVSLTIEEGTFFGIIGHTGSGKSTFIQHLNGLTPLQNGTLKVGEHNLKKYTKKEFKQIRSAGFDNVICFENGKKISYSAYKKKYLADMKILRSKVGLVFQYPEYQLFGETVFSDVAFGLKNFHPEYDENQIQNQVKAAITAVGLDFDAVKDKSPFELSGGQKRRVAIAGVIVNKPEILILDEPLAGLDPQGKNELIELLHSLHGKDVKTVIIVSHDMDDVCENCTEAAVFSNGEVVSCAPPKELFKNQAVLSLNGIEPPMTVFLTDELKRLGVNIESDFRTENFTERLSEEYKKSIISHKNDK